MTTVLIGHRGVGKTKLLKRLHRYVDQHKTSCFDLDQEIEKKTQKTVRNIFEKEGEEAFREYEKQVFFELITEHPHCYIAVGAGFHVGLIPESATVLWVQRPTDARGRIFLNRPRLEKDLTPLQEFQKRARVREMHFANAYDQIYLMPEGLTELDSLEEEILVTKKRTLAGTVTVLPEFFLKKNRWHSFVEGHNGRGLDFLEVRDDLLDYNQIQTCLGSFFSEKFIYSFRKGPTEDYPRSQQIHYYDWATELGPLPEPMRFLKQRLIISLHEMQENETLEGAIQRLQAEAGKCVHLKLAPKIENYDDLLLGYFWQQADPENRSFLPRSENGRWAWFRLWLKGRQLLNFWRGAKGSASDQPTMYDWLSTHFIKTNFAAVLGAPVEHSWTPIEQKRFFEDRNEPVFRIHVEKLEWVQALSALTAMGMRQAAVTAPLKEEAYYTSAEKSDEAESLHAVNTLSYNTETKKWRGHNTDKAGFEALVEDLRQNKKIAIWGGGGTLNMIKEVLPQALSFSSRRKEVREEDRERFTADFLPEVVIWAAPRKDDMGWPFADWKPKIVVDLNYMQDSPGLEYALSLGCEYRAGAKMFQVQAQYQRDYWEIQT